jgi:hypothetical protein
LPASSDNRQAIPLIPQNKRPSKNEKGTQLTIEGREFFSRKPACHVSRGFQTRHPKQLRIDGAIVEKQSPKIAV